MNPFRSLSPALADSSPERRGVSRPSRGDLAEYGLYVAPGGNAEKTADAWRSSDPESASLMDTIAAEPLGFWVGDWTGDVAGTVDDAISDAGDQLRTIVVYNIPERDCDAWSSGGASDAAEYTEFIAEVAEGLDGREAIVVLEPDALAYTTCLDATALAERYALLSAAVDTLTASGGMVYLDAGDSNWIPAATMATALTAAGVSRAAGFALNVSHTETTVNEIGYAGELRALVGTDAHYVIDTGRNGLGASADGEWCNPLDRALGRSPTTATRSAGLDALLWVKPPGESDGECNGGPSAGTWWEDYALGLAEMAV